MTNSGWQIGKSGPLCWGAFSFKKWLTICQAVKEILHEKREVVNIMSVPNDFIMYFLNIHGKKKKEKKSIWTFSKSRVLKLSKEKPEMAFLLPHTLLLFFPSSLTLKTLPFSL